MSEKKKQIKPLKLTPTERRIYCQMWADFSSADERAYFRNLEPIKLCEIQGCNLDVLQFRLLNYEKGY